MTLWHRHDWQLIDKTELPAPAERFGKIGGPCELPAWVFRRAVILSFKCSKCGKLRIVERSNP